MAIAIIIGKDENDRKQRQKQINAWYDALTQLSEAKVYIYPDIPEPETIEFAVCWAQPKGVFREFPNLKCVSSSGAGVNHLLDDASIAKDIPIVRVVDETLSRDMAHYVIHAVLNLTRQHRRFSDNQHLKIWDQIPPFNLTDSHTVGVMGIGEIGSFIANQLNQIQIPTIGFSRTKKFIDGIETYDKSKFDQFLNLTNILVCTLPLTAETTGVINKTLIDQLPKGAYIINIGRGAHINDNDLLKALDSNHLSGAKLDVFIKEPLPQEHPFWSHPKIEITPHNAAVSNPKSAAACVIENYKRLCANEPLKHQANRSKGY